MDWQALLVQLGIKLLADLGPQLIEFLVHEIEQFLNLNPDHPNPVAGVQQVRALALKHALLSQQNPVGALQPVQIPAWRFQVAMNTFIGALEDEGIKWSTNMVRRAMEEAVTSVQADIGKFKDVDIAQYLAAKKDA